MTFAVPDPQSDRPTLRPGLRRDAVFAVRRTAPARRRFPWRRWLFSILAVALLGGGAWALTQSGLFAVARIETGAYRFTDEHQLKVALSPLLGRNLWTVSQPDLDAAATRLPWVRQVYMQRRWPKSIAVELVEWRPLLVVAEPGAPAGAPTLVLVDDGRVLPFPANLATPALPVLTGIVVERSAGGPARLPQDVAPAVLELVSAFESTGLDAVTPVDFVVARPDGFGIVLSKDADQVSYGTLLVGREEFADRLSRYLTAREHVARDLEIDLRFKDRLTVRPRPVPEGEEGEEGKDGEGEAEAPAGEARPGDATAAAAAPKATTGAAPAPTPAATTRTTAKPTARAAAAATPKAPQKAPQKAPKKVPAKAPATKSAKPKAGAAKAASTKATSTKATSTKASSTKASSTKASSKKVAPKPAQKTDTTRKSNTAMNKDNATGPGRAQGTHMMTGRPASPAAGAAQ